MDSRVLEGAATGKRGKKLKSVTRTVAYSARQLCLKMLSEAGAVFKEGSGEQQVEAAKSQPHFAQLSTTWGSGLL